jgi:hypothetical protein
MLGLFRPLEDYVGPFTLTVGVLCSSLFCVYVKIFFGILHSSFCRI